MPFLFHFEIQLIFFLILLCWSACSRHLYFVLFLVTTYTVWIYFSIFKLVMCFANEQIFSLLPSFHIFSYLFWVFILKQWSNARDNLFFTVMFVFTIGICSQGLKKKSGRRMELFFYGAFLLFYLLGFFVFCKSFYSIVFVDLLLAFGYNTCLSPGQWSLCSILQHHFSKLRVIGCGFIVVSSKKRNLTGKNKSCKNFL